MGLYSYVKEDNVKKRITLGASYVVLTLGAFLLFWAFYPVVTFEIYARLFIKKNLITPISYASSAPISFANAQEPVSGFSTNVKDFTQASLWFPQALSVKKTNKETIAAKKSEVHEYELSIPRLNIDHAQVLVGGEDLSRALIHYPPTSLPGEPGNVAIFGHSTLPQLYSRRDYRSIFTYLPQLERGDKIVVHVQGQDYEYEIGEMYVVKPENISPIEQKRDGVYLTLVTCVPPGTYWNRLVVRAKLKNLSAKL